MKKKETSIRTNNFELMDPERLDEMMKERDTRSRISLIFENFSRILLTTSGGNYSYVLPYLIAESVKHKDFPIVFVDTGYYPKTTYQMIEGLRQDGFNVDIRSSSLTPTYIESVYGNLIDCDEKTFAWLLDQMKTIPLNDAFSHYHPEIWLRGIRREESHIRNNYPFVRTKNGIHQVYPILDWTSEEVEEFLKKRNLSMNPEHFDITKGRDGKGECPIGERSGIHPNRRF